MTELTERQKTMLEEAARRKREAATVAGLSPMEPRPGVSREEYLRRRNEMIRRDGLIAENVRSERIEQAMKEWAVTVGPRFAQATVENPRVKAIIDKKVHRIVTGGPQHHNSIVLSGDLGVGKTWAAFAYARALVESGVLWPGSIKHGTESGLLLPLMNLGFERPQKLKAFLDEKTRFYLIDDVGRTFVRDTALRHEVWYEVLNHAYDNHIPVVLTTNKSTAEFYDRTQRRNTNELEAWIGDAAYDRLRNIADIIIPGEENKRPKVNRMMDEGKVLGIEEQADEHDPFEGISVPRQASQGRKPAPRPQIRHSVEDLRPKRH